MKFEKNILIGLTLGVCVPIVGYAITMIVFEQLTDAGIMSDLTSSFGVIKRMRTMAVLAIAFNLIPFNIFKNKRNMQAMRGTVIATFIYAVVWIIYFWNSVIQ